MSGKVIVINKDTMKKWQEYKPHKKRVTDIYTDSGNKTVISISQDGKLFIRSLTKDFDDKEVNEEYWKKIGEPLCIDVVPNCCKPDSLQCFIGTSNGKLAYITVGGWVKLYAIQEPEMIHNLEKEGPVIQVAYRYGILVFSTGEHMRAVHYSRNRQNITMFPLPAKKEGMPEHLYSKKIRPCV